MNTRIIIIAFLTLSFNVIFGQELKKEYQKIVSDFIHNIKNDKRESIAKIAVYPFVRKYPIPVIKNKQEFIKRYNDVFDDGLKKMIINSSPATDWSDMGWRGIMLNNGEVWLDFDGSLTGITYQSKSEAKFQARLIENEKKNIHPSLSHYIRPICILESSTYRIRIDDLGNENYRYACWAINKSQKDKPDLILDKGVQSVEGSAANSIFKFQNGEYVYECYIDAMGDEPPAWLTVYKGDKEILKQRASIINQ
jgi:hypothetical protein